MKYVSLFFIVCSVLFTGSFAHAKGESPIQTLGGIPPLPYKASQAKQSCSLDDLRQRVQRNAESAARVAHEMGMRIARVRGGRAVYGGHSRAIAKLASQKTTMCITQHTTFYMKVQQAVAAYEQESTKLSEKRIKELNKCPSIHGGYDPRCEASVNGKYDALGAASARRHIGGTAQAAFSSMVANMKACILHRESVLRYAKKVRLRGTFMMTAHSMPMVHWQLAGSALELYQETCRKTQIHLPNRR
ncbi:MAG: hypothetical protein H6727_09100 [Myxococcales bacterium]|nr:hypothetical protein [Myxococcales bacterium]